MAKKKEPSVKKIRAWGARIAQFKYELGQDGLYEALQAMNAVEDAFVKSFERLSIHRPELIRSDLRKRNAKIKEFQKNSRLLARK
jgi:hypothetical protein